MEETDYPSLYQASDKASIGAQKNYLFFVKLDLIFMVSASLLTIYSFQGESEQLLLYIISGILLLAGLIITFIIKIQKFEDAWYECRAIAESTKTLTWRYMMCSESFEMPQNNVEKKFIDIINELRNKFSELDKYLNARILTQPIITEKMKEIRTGDVLERKNFYLKNRIEDQKNWYASKAEYNNLKQRLYFNIVITSQFLALVFVVFLIREPSINWNFVGFFTTSSSSAIAWLQLKQHQELKKAYTTAVFELNLIQEKSTGINADNDLSEFVLDSENAISREHTLWLAQRRK